MLDQAPSIATFHLKRFKTDGMCVEKIDKKIEFPLELDLQPYTILKGNDEDDVSLKYDLYAVIVHMGSSSTSGHYYCFVRTAPDTWHDLDDYKVTRVSEEIVLSQEAYILFYARQGTPWFSSVADSLVSCMYPSTMNTSPKSVLDIVDGLNKPNPTLSTNLERSEAGEFRVFSEQEVVFSCQEKPELREIADVSDASHGRGQFSAGSYQETANLNVSKNINAQVHCENNAISTGTALFERNPHIEHGTSDINKCRKEVVDSSENPESDFFHSLTPLSSPDNCFKISRDHLKMENEGSSGKSSNKSSGDAHTQEAIKYLRKHGARRRALLNCILWYARDAYVDSLFLLLYANIGLPFINFRSIISTLVHLVLASGKIGCDFIQQRLYNYQGTGQPTSSVSSGAAFDTHYYQSLLRGRGLLFADQQLMAEEKTARLVSAANG